MTTIPPAILAGIRRYAEQGIRPGSCLYAILCGDLYRAFLLADPDTSRAMAEIVRHIENTFGEVPYRSVANVEAWIAQHARRLAGAP